MAQSLNLSPVSYQKWLELVFDHPVPRRLPGAMPNLAAQWDADLRFHVSDPARLFKHMTRCCREFKAISKRFTLRQINQGIWFLLGAGFGFGKYLADPKIELQLRMDCVYAMLIPYSDFVAPSRVYAMENCFEMWWDLVCSEFWSAHLHRIKANEWNAHVENAFEEWIESADESPLLRRARLWANFDLDRDFDEQLAEAGLTREDLENESSKITISYDELEPDEQKVADAMLETLTQILQFDDGRCQYYALHGLNHLQHPRGAAVVQDFIDANRHDWDEENLAYAEACRDGEAM